MLEHILARMNALVTWTRGNERRNKRTNRQPAATPPPTRITDFRIDALNRLLASAHFRASERNKRFLKFVVEETVAGRAERIKAFTVAVDVFGRDSSFDASVDPIVRIAAGHLRRALHEYYTTHGAADPVRIRLPLGSYVPEFERRESVPRRTADLLHRLVTERKRHLQSGAVGAVMALAAAAAALTYLSLGATGRHVSQKPVVVAGSARTHGDGAGSTLAHLFTQSLWIALKEEELVRVVGVRPEEEFGKVLAQAKENFDTAVPLYQLLTTVRVVGEELHVYWHVLDGRSNEAYLSASAVEQLSGDWRNIAPDLIAREVAASLNRLAAEPKTPATGDTLLDALPWNGVEWK